MNRNHLEILSEIDSLLRTGGLESERQQLEDEVRSSSTGGELCSRAGSMLLTLKDDNEKVEKLIGKQIVEFIKYCRNNGLYPISKSKKAVKRFRVFKSIQGICGLILLCAGLFISFGILVYALKEKDNPALFNLLISFSFIVVGIILMMEARNKKQLT